MAFDPSIFKAYDVRGIYPDNLDEDIAYKIGQAYASYVKPMTEVMVGHDVRVHSEQLKKSLIQGLLDAGVNVVDVGLISTDMLYFTVGYYKLAGGITVTASHNPPEWHGMKMIREKVIPLNGEAGIYQIRDLVAEGYSYTSEIKGNLRHLDIYNDYCDYLLTWIKPETIKPLKVVVNPNFGFAGKIFEKIVERGKLPIEIIPLNGEPDGTFPKGRPDPMIPENRTEFENLVKSTGADLGIAWDADADRVFFCAEGGTFLSPYYLNTLLIKQMLKKYPGEKVIYDPRYTWATIETIKDSGGIPILERVGHTYIKERMREENAIFSGEASGHTYYRDFWYADCGMIPALQLLEYLSEHETKLTDALKPIMNKYVMSEEVNTKVADVQKKMEEVAEKYSDGEISRLDGVAIEYPEYRFCVRPSNTEPLLRLTLEATSKELMEQKRDKVLELIARDS